MISFYLTKTAEFLLRFFLATMFYDGTEKAISVFSRIRDVYCPVAGVLFVFRIFFRVFVVFMITKSPS